MYKIVALIDFTPTTEVVVDFTKKIALQKKAEVVLLTIVPKSGAEAVAEGKQKLQVYLDLLKGAGVVASAEIGEGSFFSVVGVCVDRTLVTSFHVRWRAAPTGGPRARYACPLGYGHAGGGRAQ